MEPLIGTEDDDFLFAFEDGGEVYGLDGNDTLVAAEGEDVLDAGAGDDVILGASDGDILIGGKGADTFVIDPESSGSIEIKDFELGVDKLDLSGFEHINPLDLHFEPFDYGEILILDDQEIRLNNITQGTLPGGYGEPTKLIDFETPQPPLPLALSGEYEGLTWGIFNRGDNFQWSFSHNIHPTSGTHVAIYKGSNNEHVISRDEPFTVKSLYVGSATRDGIEAIFKAYRDGDLVGQKTVIADTHQAQFVGFSAFNFGEIDRFELTMTDTGTQAADVSTNAAWMYIDDLVWV